MSKDKFVAAVKAARGVLVVAAAILAAAVAFLDDVLAFFAQ